MGPPRPAAPGLSRLPPDDGGRFRCATRRPGAGKRRSSATIAGCRAHPSWATGAWPRARPTARHADRRRTARAAKPGSRGPAAPAHAAGPRLVCPSSELRRRVHHAAHLDRHFDESDDARGDLERARLIFHIDDPVADERFLRFGVRSIGRDRDAVLKADGLGLASIREPLRAHELAGLPEVVVELAHEPDHLDHPLLAHGCQSFLRGPERHDHVLPRFTPSIRRPPQPLSPAGRSTGAVLYIWLGTIQERRTRAAVTRLYQPSGFDSSSRPGIVRGPCHARFKAFIPSASYTALAKASPRRDCCSLRSRPDSFQINSSRTLLLELPR